MKAHFEKLGIQETYSDNNTALPLTGGATPFEYMLAGVSGCIYLTIEALANKRDIQYSTVDMNFIPTRADNKIKDLTALILEITVTGATDKEAMQKTIDKAFEYGTVWVTLSRSAKMSYTVKYE